VTTAAQAAPGRSAAESAVRDYLVVGDTTSLPRVRSVSVSPSVLRLDPASTVAGPVVAAYRNPPTSGDDDFFFDLQWGHDADDAPEAWDEGLCGAGTRVAVLDSGFDLDHPDLAPNIDLASSASFVAGEGLPAGHGLRR
jgi:subtilisin family serine protease